MTVKTTIKFTADLGGAVDAGIEAIQTAVMRAHDRADVQERLERVLAELRAVRATFKGSTVKTHRHGL